MAGQQRRPPEFFIYVPDCLSCRLVHLFCQISPARQLLHLSVIKILLLPRGLFFNVPVVDKDVDTSFPFGMRMLKIYLRFFARHL